MTEDALKKQISQIMRWYFIPFLNANQVQITHYSNSSVPTHRNAIFPSGSGRASTSARHTRVPSLLIASSLCILSPLSAPSARFSLSFSQLWTRLAFRPAFPFAFRWACPAWLDWSGFLHLLRLRCWARGSAPDFAAGLLVPFQMPQGSKVDLRSAPLLLAGLLQPTAFHFVVFGQQSRYSLQGRAANFPSLLLARWPLAALLFRLVSGALPVANSGLILHQHFDWSTAIWPAW